MTSEAGLFRYPGREFLSLLLEGLGTGAFLGYILGRPESLIFERPIEELQFFGELGMGDIIRHLTRPDDELVPGQTRIRKGEADRGVTPMLSVDRFLAVDEVLTGIVNSSPSTCNNEVCRRSAQIRGWLEWLGKDLGPINAEDLYRRMAPACTRDVLMEWFGWPLAEQREPIVQGPHCERHAHLTSSVSNEDLWHELLRFDSGNHYDLKVNYCLRIAREIRPLLFAVESLDPLPRGTTSSQCWPRALSADLSEGSLWHVHSQTAFPLMHDVRSRSRNVRKVYHRWACLIHHEHAALGGGYACPSCGNLGDARGALSHINPLPALAPWHDKPITSHRKQQPFHHPSGSGICRSTLEVLYFVCRATVGIGNSYRRKPDTRGLSQFGPYYSRFTRYKRGEGKGRWKTLTRRIYTCVLNGYRHEEVLDLEVRLALDPGSKGRQSLRNLNLAWTAHRKMPQTLERLSVLVHAKKNLDKDRPGGPSPLQRLQKVKHDAERQAKTALWLQEIKAYGDLIRGFDAAALESHGVVEQFITAFNRMSAGTTGVERRSRPNRLTYHAGEDPRSPICGLREIWHAVSFLGVRRIGHGTVLGWRHRWLAKTMGSAAQGWPVSPLDHLLNLLWDVELMGYEGYRRATLRGCTGSPCPYHSWFPSNTPWIVTGQSLDYRQCHCPACQSWSDNVPHAEKVGRSLPYYLQEMQRLFPGYDGTLRRGLNSLLLTYHSLGAVLSFLHSAQFCSREMTGSAAKEVWRLATQILDHTLWECPDSPLKAIETLEPTIWTSPGSMVFGDKNDSSGETGTHLIHTRRALVLRILKINRVVIECCPTSNALIVHVDYEDHPAHFLRQLGIRTALCLDNRGLLGVTVGDEYENIIRTSTRNDIDSAIRNWHSVSREIFRGASRDNGF